MATKVIRHYTDVTKVLQKEGYKRRQLKHMSKRDRLDEIKRLGYSYDPQANFGTNVKVTENIQNKQVIRDESGKITGTLVKAKPKVVTKSKTEPAPRLGAKANTIRQVETGVIKSKDDTFFVTSQGVATGKAAEALRIKGMMDQSRRDDILVSELEGVRRSGGTVRAAGTSLLISQPSRSSSSSSEPMTGFERAVSAQKARQEKSSERYQNLIDFTNKVTSVSALKVTAAKLSPIGIFLPKKTKELTPTPYEKRTMPGKTAALGGSMLFGGMALGGGAGVATAIDKIVILEKYRKEYTPEQYKSARNVALKSDEFKDVFKPWKPEGAVTWGMIGLSVGGMAYGDYTAPVRAPKGLTGKTASASEFIALKDTTMSRSTAKFKSSSPKKIVARDTHTIRKTNIKTGKSTVDVFIGKEKGTTVSMVKVGDKGYMSATKGSRTTVYSDIITGPKAKITSKTSVFGKTGEVTKTFKPRSNTVKLPEYRQTEKSVDLVSTDYNFIKKGNKMLESKTDLYSTRNTYQARTGLTKKSIIDDRGMFKVTSSAETKASMFTDSEAWILRKGQQRVTGSDYTKDTRADLEFGKITRPKDIIESNIEQVGGIELITTRKSRGSRFIKNVENKYENIKSTRIMRQERVMPGKETASKMLGSKRAQSQLGLKLVSETKTKTLNIGSRLKTSMDYGSMYKPGAMESMSLRSGTPLLIGSPSSLQSRNKINTRSDTMTQSYTTIQQPRSMLDTEIKSESKLLTAPILRTGQATLSRTTQSSQLLIVPRMKQRTGQKIRTITDTRQDIITRPDDDIITINKGKTIPDELIIGGGIGALPFAPVAPYLPRGGGSSTGGGSVFNPKYTASLTAELFNIKGTKPFGYRAGISIRPIIVKGASTKKKSTGKKRKRTTTKFRRKKKR